MNKKNLNLIIMTVVYPGATNHAKQFVNSMNNQTNKKFSLIVVNDNNKNAVKKIDDKSNFEVRSINSRRSRVNNRIKGLRFIIKETKFKYIAFLDIDDYPEKNFVKSIHDFTKKNSKVKMFSTKLKMKNNFFQKKNSLVLSDIIDDHQVGYGTLCLRKDFIEDFILASKYKTLLFDWFISLIYLLKYKFIHINDKSTINYSSSTKTTLKRWKTLNKKNIVKIINLKKDLYSKVLKFSKDKNYRSQRYIFKKKILDMSDLSIFIKDKKRFKEYIKHLKKYIKNKKNLGWLDNAQPLYRLGL